jgi:hypothetical protein
MAGIMIAVATGGVTALHQPHCDVVVQFIANVRLLSLSCTARNEECAYHFLYVMIEDMIEKQRSYRQKFKLIQLTGIWNKEVPIFPLEGVLRYEHLIDYICFKT